MDDMLLERFELFSNNVSIMYRGIQQLKQEVMKGYGLKGNHYICMFYLNKNKEGLTVSQLSKLASIDKAAISRAVSELCGMGIIEYVDFEGGKKYNTLVTLTQKGSQVMKELDVTLCTLVDKISLNHVDEDARTVMYRSMRQIAQNILDCIDETKNKGAKP